MDEILHHLGALNYAGWHVGPSLFVRHPLEVGRSLRAATVDTSVQNDP